MLDELLYTEMTAVDLLREWYPPPPLTVPLATGEWRARYARMIFVYQIRNWEDDETPPAWDTLDVTVTDIFPLITFRLGRLLWRKQKLSEESDIVTTTQREQVRWRWIWEIDDHPMAWRMVHIRWRYEERLTENGVPSTTWVAPTNTGGRALCPRIMILATTRPGQARTGRRRHCPQSLSLRSGSGDHQYQ
ncbi:hypothetical protein [Verrucomicrobium spinosum]|uniref:hypothetical protein n=1 Tax=Verrucomicrobium spinosum TaxID=2736 RepID=UPI000ADA30EF|nr:hypothetical protein [Verrucomicrobium spinosum]